MGRGEGTLRSFRIGRHRPRADGNPGNPNTTPAPWAKGGPVALRSSVVSSLVRLRQTPSCPPPHGSRTLSSEWTYFARGRMQTPWLLGPKDRGPLRRLPHSQGPNRNPGALPPDDRKRGAMPPPWRDGGNRGQPPGLKAEGRGCPTLSPWLATREGAAGNPPSSRRSPLSTTWLPSLTVSRCPCPWRANGKDFTRLGKTQANQMMVSEPHRRRGSTVPGRWPTPPTSDNSSHENPPFPNC